MDNKGVNVRKYVIAPEQLYWSCDPDSFSFENTEEVSSLEEIMGQERALRALEMGLETEHPGYNLFVSGFAGSGRAEAVKKSIQNIIRRKKEAGQSFEIFDWCYVFNFDNPDQPKMLRLSRGEGKNFARSSENLLKVLKEIIPKAFSSDEYKNQKQILIDNHQRKHRQIIQELEKMALEEGFVFRATTMGPILVPLVDGKPMTQEQYLALSDEEKENIENKRQQLLTKINKAFEKIHQLEIELKNQIRELDEKVAEFTIAPYFLELIEKYREIPDIVEFLKSLKNFTLQYIHIFRDTQENQPVQPLQLLPIQRLQDPFLPFKINVFVDNSETENPPVIFETHPNWVNLFGRIERRAFMGTYFSDHTMLKAGSLHKANGGYIIMYLKDLLVNPGTWDGLKRVLKTGMIRMEDPFEQYGLIAPQGLRPDPLPFKAKVVLIGEEIFYQLLTSFDEDFRELFKVKAHFDYQINKNSEIINSFAGFIKTCCQNNNLLPFHKTAVAKVIEYATRLAAHKEKITSRLGFLKDVLIEADYWARKEEKNQVFEQHVQKAIQEKRKRLNLIEERIQELIEENTLLIDTQGEAIGQVNGLAVYDLGDYSFGKPSRITARVFLGKQGVVNIERESRLSGKIHDKGVLILSGYLGHKYAQDKPLSISASICFEQSYEGIEGDSASLAETCAILSSLAEIPIRQSIAVTGSINQKGEVQAIGGVNQKIEGFFRVCKARGLDGNQGVIIPESNIKNLMLDKEVIEAAKANKFHIYAVKTVDEAMEILTGLPAGKRKEDGKFEEGTINYLVDKKLWETVNILKKLQVKEGEEKTQETPREENQSPK